MNSLMLSITLIALLLKVWALFLAYSGREKLALFFALTAVFFAINLFSVITLLNVQDASSIEWTFRAYYVCTLWAVTIMSLYAVQVAKAPVEWRYFSYAIAFGAVILTALALSTDLILSGTKSLGYSVTAVKGEWFSVYLLFAAVALLFTVTTLLIATYRSVDILVRNQTAWTLAALLPVILVGLGIGTAMFFGVKINASGLMPMATSLFLIITLKTEPLHRLTDIRRFFPFSQERKFANEMLLIASKYSLDEISYKELKGEVEKAIVGHDFQNAGTVSGAARKMQLDRTTVSGMIKRHGLKPN